MTGFSYSSSRWRRVAARARTRDGNRCTVGRLLGGECSDLLHVHHIVAVSDGGAPYDLDNVGTACSTHHPTWESLRRLLVRRQLEAAPKCRHFHPTAEARAICERRLARQRVAA